AIMAFSWGDAWTNMLQPFWALPLLGIMDLEARDIIGYTALVMLVTGPVIMVLLVML
ncbi:MAG: TIGR00366 family protein, partial [Bradymonadaceae bacterium]